MLFTSTKMPLMVALAAPLPTRRQLQQGEREGRWRGSSERRAGKLRAGGAGPVSAEPAARVR